MTDKIIVTIDDNEFFKSGLPVSAWESFCITKLKEAGVPIIGYLSFEGVREGTLKRLEDIETGETVYVWATDE